MTTDKKNKLFVVVLLVLKLYYCALHASLKPVHHFILFMHLCMFSGKNANILLATLLH